MKSLVISKISTQAELDTVNIVTRICDPKYDISSVHETIRMLI